MSAMRKSVFSAHKMKNKVKDRGHKNFDTKNTKTTKFSTMRGIGEKLLNTHYGKTANAFLQNSKLEGQFIVWDKKVIDSLHAGAPVFICCQAVVIKNEWDNYRPDALNLRLQFMVTDISVQAEKQKK